MAKKENKMDDQFAKIETTLSRTEQYIENNQNQTEYFVRQYD